VLQGKLIMPAHGGARVVMRVSVELRGTAGETRLKETKGTVWVVYFSPLAFRVFETQPDADRRYQEQLHLDNKSAYSPVRYVGGQRQTH
jgi:hypothetical protein